LTDRGEGGGGGVWMQWRRSLVAAGEGDGGGGGAGDNIMDQTRARKIKRAIEGGMRLARPFVSS
jgi:hypothetical protein